MGGKGHILINVLIYRSAQARQPCWKCKGSLYLLHAGSPPCWNSAVSKIKYISKVVYEKERERERLANFKKISSLWLKGNSARLIFGPFKALDTNSKKQTHPVKKAYYHSTQEAA